MKKRNFPIIAVVTLFLLLTAGIAASGHGWFGGRLDEFDVDAAVNRIASRLDFTESQRVELGEIAADIVEKVKEILGNREERHRELADLIRRETIEHETVDRMATERAAKMQELTDFALPRLIDFHGALTPEQREKIAVYIEERTRNRGWLFRRW
jgi:Spy/CpxP family protein refolding chaperone